MAVYIVDIEAVDTRYTAQWKKYLPQSLKIRSNDHVEVISGGDTPQATTPGAFLNFGGTNVYKSKQLEIIGEKFCNGEIKDGDYFLYTDAWNPTVIQLRYMAELLGVNIKIGGLWHAGSYDPQDFLGRLIGDKPWVRQAEVSMYHCYDDNFFATDFHIELFEKTFGAWTKGHEPKQVGWPMEYLKDIMEPFKGIAKEDIILFPHRIAPEKQPEIFRDLAQSLPQYKFVFAQDTQLTKDEYHTLLSQSKMVFSANLQETLGISWYESALVNTFPLVPDRLSYSEMATDDVLYPSEWTESWDSYITHKQSLISRIVEIMSRDNTEINNKVIDKVESFFSGDKLYESVLR
jgi:glycosyltransferase involved in cell wall biosynthesis